MKTIVLIPTYNESKAIGELVKKIRLQKLDALVVDDGSIDNTADIARENQAIVLVNQTNLGKGASLIKGFSYAMNNGYEAIVTIDGDGQHLPEEIHGFIEHAVNSGSGIVIGNRMSHPKNMPLIRIWTNKFMSWIISRIAKQKIPDSQCGFRLIKTDVLKKIELTTTRYETESEILIKGSLAGFKISSIPIETIYSNEKSRINPFIDTVRFVKLINKIK